MTQPFVYLILLACACMLGALLYIAALSRHRKAATGELQLVGAFGSVEKVLEPEGSVLVGGELWRARSRTGVTLSRGHRVRVVGASSHLLEVEPIE
jgi:membrane-bound ClpP family serine protease